MSSWPWRRRPLSCGQAGASTSPSWPTTSLQKSGCCAASTTRSRRPTSGSPCYMMKPTRKPSSARPRGLGPSSMRPSWKTQRLHPLRQPRRRPFLHRLCAQDRPVRTVGGTQGHHQGRRRRAAPGSLPRGRSRSPHRPDTRPALLPTRHGRGQLHNSALCSVSAVLITRIAACWRKRSSIKLRDEDGEAITEAEGKAACTDRFKIDPKVRPPVVAITSSKVFKNRASFRVIKDSTQKVVTATDPPREEASENVA